MLVVEKRNYVNRYFGIWMFVYNLYSYVSSKEYFIIIWENSKDKVFVYILVEVLLNKIGFRMRNNLIL